MLLGFLLVKYIFQVLRQLAPDVSYRSFVALGIASIQGLAVASFEKDDAARLLFFSGRHQKHECSNNLNINSLPTWLRSPAPSRKRIETCQPTSIISHNGALKKEDLEKESVLRNGISVVPTRQKLKVATLRPIPHVRHQKMLPFSGISEVDGHEGNHVKPNLPPVAPLKHGSAGGTPASHRKSTSSSYQAKQMISLNPLPLKKHGCGRSPIHVCSEASFFSLSKMCIFLPVLLSFCARLFLYSGIRLGCYLISKFVGLVLGILK